jgi:hypothetical protein
MTAPGGLVGLGAEPVLMPEHEEGPPPPPAERSVGKRPAHQFFGFPPDLVPESPPVPPVPPAVPGRPGPVPPWPPLLPGEVPPVPPVLPLLDMVPSSPGNLPVLTSMLPVRAERFNVGCRPSVPAWRRCSRAAVRARRSRTRPVPGARIARPGSPAALDVCDRDGDDGHDDGHHEVAADLDHRTIASSAVQVNSRIPSGAWANSFLIQPGARSSRSVSRYAWGR